MNVILGKLKFKELARISFVAMFICALSWAMLQYTSLTKVAVVWPINGLFIGVCLLSEKRNVYLNFFGFFLGSLGLSIWQDSWSVASLGIALSHLLEVVFVWYMLNEIVGKYKSLGHPQVLWRFSLLGVLVAPVLSGSVSSLFIVALEPYLDYWRVFLAWWASNALGMALFAPLVVTFRPSEWRQYVKKEKIAPMLIPFMALVLTTYVVFNQEKYPLLFMIFPPLIWLVFRWGFPGATIGGLAILGIGFTMTAIDRGPAQLMNEIDLIHKYVLIQIFMAMALLSALPVGMILDYKNRLTQKLKKREQELEHMAMNDALTEVLNRRGFMMYLDAEYKRAQEFGLPLTVVCLDIDYFKKYNDTYGHPEGDECLSWLAEEMRVAAKSVYGICARQGGEEFAIIISGLNFEEAEMWANMFCERIRSKKRVHIGSPSKILTVSLGVAHLNPSMESRNVSPSRLLTVADKALYDAKESGRNKVVAISA